MISHGLNWCESLGRSHPGDKFLRIKQLRFHSAQTLIKDIYLLMIIDVVVVKSLSLLCGHGRWAIPLNKGLFKKIPGIDSSWGEFVHPPFYGSGGILQRLEAFIASPIGCGGSDVGIA
ncbi:hypothetical protein Tco_1077593 [Tanacetum coccineum]